MERFVNTVVVATNNRNKIPEIIDNLDMDGWRYVTPHSLGLDVIPEETGETYEENARIKARAAWLADSSMATLADDSGIEVKALGGAPGIRSSRYAKKAQAADIAETPGKPGAAAKETTDQSNISKLLEKLKHIPEEERAARFVCTIVYIDEEGREIISEGICEGKIAHAPRGSFGFGYDPVFLPDEIKDGRTMAELTAEEKNSISHRGRALRALREKLFIHYGLPRQHIQNQGNTQKAGRP